MTAAGLAPTDPGELAGSERGARALLAAVTEPGDPAVCALVASVGAGGALAAITDGVLPAGTLSQAAAGRYRRRLSLTDPGAVAEATARVGARVVVPGDEEWPGGLADLDAVRSGQGWGGSPVALWVVGPLPLATATSRSVALVGSREATAYGCSVAADLAAGLVDGGWSIASGGAYGIDGAAHRGALAAGGPTLAVLAGGVDVLYPRGHRALLERVAEEGLLVSESPPGAFPTRRAFLIRNRLIAALTAGTVVVEAALRSGALNTATWANACLRVVMAVPGPVISPLSAGTHRLIRDAEAVLVGDAADVAATLSAESPAPSPAPAEQPLPGLSADAGDPRAGLDQDSAAVLDVLAPLRPTGLAAVLAATGLSPAVALAALGRLSAAGVVASTDGGWRLSPATRAWIRRTAKGPR